MPNRFVSQLGPVKEMIANSPAAKLEKLLQQRAEQQSYSGFLPDQGMFDEAMAAQIDEILGRLPAGIEDFNADLASRGLFTAGEAPKYLYTDVIAPVARAAASVVGQSRLQFAGMQQQGRIAEVGAQSQALGQWMNFIFGQEQLRLQREQIKATRDAAKWGAIGEVAGSAASFFL